MAVAIGRRNTLRTGPWPRVYNTRDPFDPTGPEPLRDARNIYIPAPEERSGIYARPGFDLLNNGNAVHTSATPFKGQGCYTHFALDGTSYNFVVFGGKLYREDPATELFTDVTPVGVTIDSATTTRVGFNSLGGVMAVSDGVNRPWVASNLSSTPITGTYIDFDGAGTAWVAYGPPCVWGGAGFFILVSVNGVGARIDIVWTEPNDWTTGYQQADFDNRWTLEQTGTTPIFGLAPTNVALNYFRQRSIGSIAGTVGIDLATTATHDAVSNNVGTEAPWTIVLFGDFIFFCDVIGRPWMFANGSPPKPIWHQLRAVVDDSTTGFPGVTARVAVAAFDPTLNQYCVAIWSPNPASSASPTEWHVFDADTGNYAGRGSIGPVVPGVSVDFMGSFLDDQGRGQLIVLGSATSAGTTGYVWGMSPLVAEPATIVLEDLMTILTDESTPGVEITTEGTAATWQDDNDLPVITATTDRLGYSEELNWKFDELTVLTGNDTPITVTVTTPNASDVVAGTPTPNASADGINRTVFGLDAFGRGLEVTVSPTTAESQWSLHRVTVVGVPNPAGQDDA